MGREHQQRGRQAGQAGRQQRRAAPVGRLRRGAEVMTAEVVHRPARQRRPRGMPLAGRIGAVVAAGGRRIDQQLERDRRPARIARHQRRGRRQRRTGAVAGHGQPGGVATETANRLGDPAERGEAVLDGRGIRMLRREAIGGGDDHDAAVRAELAAHRVIGIEVAQHETATVEVQRHRQGAGSATRPVDADPQGLAAEAGLVRRHLHVGGRHGGGRADLPVQAAAGVGRQVAEIGRTGRLGEHVFQMQVEHGVSFKTIEVR